MRVVLAKLSLVCISLIVISLMLTGQSSAKIDQETIVGMWLFDEGKGEVTKDSSGNGNDGKLMNGPKWVDGKFGKALEFDGTDDNVEMPNDSGLPSGAQDRTISAWVKVDSFKNGRVFSYGAWSPGNAFDLIEQIEHKFMIIGHTNNYSTTKTNFSTGDWYHIAAVLEGDDLTFYYNGIKDSTQPVQLNTILRKDTFRIGNGVGDIDQWFDGVIDEVALFNVALTEDDIKSIMTRGLSSTSAVSPSGKIALTWGTIKTDYRLNALKQR